LQIPDSGFHVPGSGSGSRSLPHPAPRTQNPGTGIRNLEPGTQYGARHPVVHHQDLSTEECSNEETIRGSAEPAHVGAGWNLAAAQKAAPGGYVLERDADIALAEPGTHNGGGQTVGYSFFKKVPRLALVFRKRALKPGSGIGYHEQKEDEIYYVLSGRGTMTIDGKPVDVGPGDAVLTRPGSSHGLKQTGADDLVIMINYEQKVP